jgi:uncharacterized protein GlcG (DUF336 family)
VSTHRIKAKGKIKMKSKMSNTVILGSLMALGSISTAFAVDRCDQLGLGNKEAIHATLLAALGDVAPDTNPTAPNNAGLGNHMWATIVDADGKVCAVAFSGPDRFSQWPASRAISAQKAHTAGALSLPAGAGGFPDPDGSGKVDALSTANLWFATQPGGSLWGLNTSNPVDPAVAYGNNAHGGGGNPERYGTENDPLKGDFIGGINYFGGGLALYNQAGERVGALGASGDTSCYDHNVAWRVRDKLGLDFVPGGLGPNGAEDNIIYDVAQDAAGHIVSPSGFGHTDCGFGEPAANAGIVAACPTGDGTTPACDED